MIMLEELTFFLGLQLKQHDSEIFINKVKCTKEFMKKFGNKACSATATPMSSLAKLNKN